MVEAFRRVLARAGARGWWHRQQAALAEIGTLGVRGIGARLEGVRRPGTAAWRDGARRDFDGGRGWAMGFDWKGTVRALVRRPGYPALMAATLALGITVEAAVLGVADTVLVAPSRGGRLAGVWTTTEARGDDATPGIEGPTLRALRRMPDLFSAVEGVGSARSGALTDLGDPRYVRVAPMTPGLLRLLRVPPAVGGGFAADGSTDDGQVMLSHGIWRERYGADPALVGRTIELDGRRRTVVGVLPRGFSVTGTDHADVLIPLVLADTLGGGGVFAVARLRPGLDLETADRALAGRAPELQAAGAVGPEARPRLLEPLFFGPDAGVVRVVRLALGATLAVLLVASINLLGLGLARGLDQRGEWSIRMALGASRRRVVAAAAGEGIVMGLAAGLGGAALGAWVLYLLGPHVPARFDLESSVGGTLGVSAVETVVVVATAIAVAALVGAVSALLGTRPGTGGLSSAATESRTGRRVAARLRRGLVAAQVALSFVLLGGAGLLLGTMVHLARADTGYDLDHTLVATVEPQRDRYGTVAERRQLYERVRDGLARLPGVEGVGAASLAVPRSAGRFKPTLEVDGSPPMQLDDFLPYLAVDPGFFAAAGLSVLRGRGFTEADPAVGPVIVDASLARRLWPDGSAVGKRLRVATADDDPWLTVVGVVDDAAQVSVRDDMGQGMEYYVPLASDDRATERTFLIRTAAGPAALEGPARAVMRDIDPLLPYKHIGTLKEAFATSVARERFLTGVASFLGLLAVVLTAVGLYGLLAHHVRARTREIGIRVALGAHRRRVLARVVAEGLAIAATGVLVGAAAALLLNRSLRAFLFGLEPGDPVTMVATATAFALMALLAALPPARRAVSVDPVEAMRVE